MREVGYGLSLEGASSADLMKSCKPRGRARRLERKRRMTSAPASPEKFDRVILGGGTGLLPLGRLLDSKSASLSSTANTLAEHAPTSPACPARASSTVQRSRPTFGKAGL